MTGTDVRTEPEAESASPPRRAGRLAEIQGLRAIAVLLVVVYHSGLPVPGGFVGVDVFFVISGFVITRLLLREAGRHGRVRFGNFYSRRIRRLLPASALMVSVTVLGSMLLQSPVGAQSATAISGIGASTWTANGALFFLTHGYFALNLHTMSLLHTWSLAVEEQFYLVFPAVVAIGVFLARRSRRGTPEATVRYLTGLVVVGTVLSFLVSVWLTFDTDTVPAARGLAYYSPMSRAWEFGVGALVCLVPLALDRRRSRLPDVLAGVGLAVVIASAFLIDSRDAFPGYVALAPVLGTALVIASIGERRTAVAAFLSTRPLQRVGDWSYSWYLWHWPLIVLVQVYWPANTLAMVLAAAVSLPVAVLSYTWVEEPLRHPSRPRRLATARLALVCIAVPVALCLALLAGVRSHWGNEGVRDFATQVEPKSLGQAECLTTVPMEERDLAACTFGGSGGQPIILAGDSNAAGYADALDVVGTQLGRPVVVATTQGCPLVDVRADIPGTLTSLCHDAYANSMEWLVEQDPALVVVAGSPDWVDFADAEMTDIASGDRITDAAGKGKAWEQGTVRTIEDLQAAGHTVLLVTSIPHFYEALDRAWGPETCAFLTAMRDAADCGDSMSRAEADRRQRHALDAEVRAAEATGVSLADVRSKICRDDVCATNVGNTWVYRDGGHLTVQESRRLEPVFERAVRRATRAG